MCPKVVVLVLILRFTLDQVIGQPSDPCPKLKSIKLDQKKFSTGKWYRLMELCSNKNAKPLSDIKCYHSLLLKTGPQTNAVLNIFTNVTTNYKEVLYGMSKTDPNDSSKWTENFNGQQFTYQALLVDPDKYAILYSCTPTETGHKSRAMVLFRENKPQMDIKQITDEFIKCNEQLNNLTQIAYNPDCS